MSIYILRRILSVIPTLVLVGVVVFVLIRLVPGDPAQVMLGDSENPDALEALRQRLGLDKPYVVQFGLWLGNILQGDLGNSIVTDEPVLSTILSRFTVTAQVTLLAIVLASLLAIPLGMLAAHRQGKLTDGSIVFMTVLFLSLPSFWVGLLLILVFGVWLGWLPFVGWVSVFEAGPGAVVFLIMPVAALVVTEIATIARMVRATAIDVLRLDYIANARSKGLSETTVIWKHAFPNAFAPTLTFIGIVLGSLLGGAAVTETVFTLPGLGRLLVDSIYARDYPVVQGCLLFIATIFVIVNLIVDLIYPLLDPRVKL